MGVEQIDETREEATMKRWPSVIGACAIALSGSVHAEVKQSAADGFLVTFTSPVTATPARTYAAIAQPQLWWSSEHTWSGKAANLSLKPEAGGCFCERWKDGSAEHGRVIMALPDKLLRLDSALGPLQEFALKATLSFWIKTGDEGATQLSVEYRVNGASGSALDKFAPSVDEVLGEQVARLVRYIDSGNPEAPPVAKPAAKEDDPVKRAAILEEWKKSAEAAKANEANSPGSPKDKPVKAKPSKPAGKDLP
jgi:uncharacterized protein YndB with AHSA1/START domain